MIIVKTKKGILECTKEEFSKVIIEKKAFKGADLIKDKKRIRCYELDKEITYEDVIDHYDFNGLILFNAKKLLELIDKGELIVRE